MSFYHIFLFMEYSFLVLAILSNTQTIENYYILK